MPIHRRWKEGMMLRRRSSSKKDIKNDAEIKFRIVNSERMEDKRSQRRHSFGIEEKRTTRAISFESDFNNIFFSTNQN